MININKIRFKLTLLNSFIVLIILICIAAFINVTVSINNTTTIDNELTNSAYMLKRYVSVADNSTAAGLTQELIDEYATYKERLSATYISYGIYGAGDVCFVSQSSYRLPEEALSGIRKLPFTVNDGATRTIEETDGTYYIHTYNYNDLNLRICTTVTSSEDGSIRIIQTVYNLNIQDSITDRLSRSLLLAILLGVTLSFIFGYFIAGWSIKPIEQNMQRQNEFIADASHELRTPITIIKTNLDVVKADEEETVASQMEWIDSAYREIWHMEKLISDLLDTVKADLGRIVSDMSDVKINEICEMSVARFKQLAENKNISLNYLPYNENLTVCADRAKLIQLLGIILDNAVRYTPQGKRIFLSLTREDDRVKITITDEGIGLEKEDCEKIFERFYRTDKARSRAEGGSGLGLSIAREITIAHQGTIYAESEKGKGTKVTVVLPLKEN